MSCPSSESLLPGLRGKDGAWKGAGEGRGGRRMNGNSFSCGFTFIDLVINNGMNLKCISGVSAKAGYFCHKWHVTAVQWGGEEKGRRAGGQGAPQQPVLCRCRRAAFILGLGKFSAPPDWRSLSETP